MTQLTVRGVDEQLHLALKNEAARQDVSMNRYLVRVLSEAVGEYQAGAASARQDYTDLDHLAGTWTDEEADEFEQTLETQRPIDRALWP